EIEQLLRDYPAALELYRTKKYKVKVKYEADVERVILVEKRSSKNASNHASKANDVQQSKQSTQDTSNDVNQINEEVKKTKDSQHVRSRTHSKEQVPSLAKTTSTIENTEAAQISNAGSSNQLTNNAQSKADQSQRLSKERDLLTTSQSKQDQQSFSRGEKSHDSRSVTSHTKRKGKRHSRDYPTALVPYVPNANVNTNMWQQSRALQPYYNHNNNNSLYQHQQQYPSNYYMPPAIIPQQNPMYPQQYYYPPQGPYPITPYQQQPHYPSTIQSKSAGHAVTPNVRSPRSYQSSSRNGYQQHQGANLPQAFHTYHPAQPYYPNPQAALYPTQLQYPMQPAWPAPQSVQAYPVVNTNYNVPYVESRRNSKHRAQSVDTGPRGVPLVSNYAQPPQQQQSAGAVVEQQYYHQHRHHHHHHHRPPNPPDVQVNAVAPPVEIPKPPSVPQTAAPPAAAAAAVVNQDNTGEKLTIRQLNEMFVQVDPSGRLAYQAVPPVLQRFGMNIGENDLMSAAQDLKYNVGEPISARRLVHVLVKLGKIAKSTNQPRPPQPQSQAPISSPPMLPEDREVTDILNQRRASGMQSTHIHSSVYPNYWY
ncbi:unnamed protein product, partial [Adineta ricciae]